MTLLQVQSSLILLSVIAIGVCSASVARVSGPAWQQFWAEEFNPCNSTTDCLNGINLSVWSFEQGDGTKYGPYLAGWGNNEVQCYTNRTQNARVLATASGSRGVLSVEATFETEGYKCANPVNPAAEPSTKWWTSARLISKGKAAFAPTTSPIKIEARVKIPSEWGAWSAFWLLPDTSRTDCLACGAYGNGWCSSGEIDILETVNRNGVVRQVVHYGGLPDASYLDCHQAMVDTNLSTAAPYWTRVSAVWSAANISFFINDTLTQVVPQIQWYTGGADKAANPQAPFDQPFYLLLNLAVGGNFPTSQTGGVLITDTKRAPYKLLVDYVRVYRWA